MPKISDLSAVSSLSTTDVFPVEQSDATRKLTIEKLKTSIADTTPVSGSTNLLTSGGAYNVKATADTASSNAATALSTANTAANNAATALATANTASSTATTAQTTANSIKSEADTNAADITTIKNNFECWYKATLATASWTSGTDANSVTIYTQTVTPTSITTFAPTIIATGKVIDYGIPSTTTQATNETYVEIIGMIDKGYVVCGAGTVTFTTFEQPSVDVELWFKVLEVS